MLAEFGLVGSRNQEYTGVWVGDAKVAAIGVNVSRWVTMHGFALNVNCDLTGFERVVPCGIDDPSKSVASIQSLLPHLESQPTVETVAPMILRHFENVFNVRFDPASASLALK